MYKKGPLVLTQSGCVIKNLTLDHISSDLKIAHCESVWFLNQHQSDMGSRPRRDKNIFLLVNKTMVTSLHEITKK